MPAQGCLTLDEALARLDRLKTRPQRAVHLLGRNLHLCADARVARCLMECAITTSRFDVAEDVLTVAEDPSGLMRAHLCLVRDDPAGAVAALRAVPANALDRARFFGLRVRALALSGNYSCAVTATFEWAADFPGAPVPYRTLARALADGDDPRAQDWFECAVFVTGGNTSCRLDLAEHLMEQGKAKSARAHLDILTAANGTAARRRDALMRAL
ncbi:hypothetical protein [Pseudooctadecabacter sp.]|uniref:hypothetical protein n=1 Tax=Pseudooctadecabacter sp. TaxID=1966338 RepID=UPI0035C86950